MKQHTIKSSVSIKGVGLHTGKEATVKILPAPINHGFKFQRVDLENKPIIKADVSKVVSTNRSTTIESNEASITTIEHLLSALVGTEIDNALIEIDGPEVPILDGSAIQYVEAILSVGREEQEADVEYFEITEPISYKDEATGSELLALPSEDFQIYTLIDFNSPVLGHQYAKLDNLADYQKEIAPCRTFVFVKELEHLLEQNLIKGGDIDNAVVIANDAISQERCDQIALKLGKQSVTVKEGGILNTTDLLYKNEPARHKLLDVIGDLALIGTRIKGKIIATKPGHTANIAFASLLKKQHVENKRLKGKPKYDPNVAPLLNTVQIAAMLPHRYPFLFVDKIIELTESHVVGVKNVTFNEYFFQGHFPNNPVFPGVLQIEALAQTGGILALSTVPDPENWDTYFLKIDNTKFKYKVLPGDTLIFKMELKAPIRRGIVQMRGTAYVGNRIVSEGDLTAQIVKRTKET